MKSPPLRKWLRFGKDSLAAYRRGRRLDPTLPPHYALSQINVLRQIEHLRSYPEVKRRTLSGTLRLHGWWFDIRHADVYVYEPDVDRFVVIDEGEAKQLLARFENSSPRT